MSRWSTSGNYRETNSLAKEYSWSNHTLSFKKKHLIIYRVAARHREKECFIYYKLITLIYRRVDIDTEAIISQQRPYQQPLAVLDN